MQRNKVLAPILMMLGILGGCRTMAPPRLVFGGLRGSYASMAEFIQQLDSLNLSERENLLKAEIFAGNVPRFLTKWKKVLVEKYQPNGKLIRATFYVMPDYLSIGNDQDFFRVPLSPIAGQAIADQFRCFLPTRKMVDEIYRAAEVKLQPIPLTKERERVLTFFEHHKLIETLREEKKGLLAGVKKDVVISSAVTKDGRPDRVAIYGWHQPNGRPIQPLYTGHVNWYVDYSHGIRLVYEMIDINGRWMHYKDVLSDTDLKELLCDEEQCDFYGYW